MKNGLQWEDSRRNAANIGREIGVSTRTVNRRVGAMIDGKVFFLIPVCNVQRSTGLLCSFLIGCPERSKNELDLLIGAKHQRIDFLYLDLKNFYIVTLVSITYSNLKN